MSQTPASPTLHQPSESLEHSRTTSPATDGVVPVISHLPYNVIPSPTEVQVLIIVMQKKLETKAMKGVLHELQHLPNLMISALAEDLIFSAPVDQWPKCDCLIAFSSSGYPLEKVQKYQQLHRPFVLNSLKMQHVLQNRQLILSRMVECRIPCPRFIVLDRDTHPDVEVLQSEDSITINGSVLNKPFVMKPMNAGDHDIYIFFHSQDGGGAQHLFRKRKDRSSEFLPDYNSIPQIGSFVFEEFLPTGGTDIKVYTVGPTYAHAEGRKAPVLDGKVLRDENGKEMRCPILLSPSEKDIAKKIVEAFGQNICGFDLLRTQDNKSYVCDVNGWSFVKRSPHYFSDCARLMHSMILAHCGNGQCSQTQPINSLTPSLPTTPPTSAQSRKPVLRCVVALIRHGDRTPKEKLKVKVSVPSILGLFDKYGSKPFKEIVLKSKSQLQYVLDLITSLVDGEERLEESLHTKLRQIQMVLLRWPISGINRKFQLKPLDYNDDGSVKKAQIVMKWGGELTDSGLTLASKAGAQFRERFYPQSESEGLLRLHSTYKHDLKIYSSDEGRVQMTAAAFSKGLLVLDGQVTPIISSLVRKDKAVHSLLDNTHDAKTLMNDVKIRLHDSFARCHTPDSLEDLLIDPKLQSTSVQRAINVVEDPALAMEELHSHLTDVVRFLQGLILSPSPVRTYQHEPIEMLVRRWLKLEEDFFDEKKKKFDISKIPDIYDTVKYHLYHNQSLNVPNMQRILSLSKALADIVVPLEYGITKEDKHEIALKIATPLFQKVTHDFFHSVGLKDSYSAFGTEVLHLVDRRHSNEKVPTGRIRTRLYFTSESHVHATVNLLRTTDHLMSEKMQTISELNYLSHVVWRLFENPAYPNTHPKRFTLEIQICGGRQLPLSGHSAKEYGLSDFLTVATELPLQSFALLTQSGCLPESNVARELSKLHV